MNFVGIDGEAINHTYVLLTAADASGQFTESIENLDGLSSEKALDWLCKMQRRARRRLGRTTFVWFYGDYDANHLLRDLSNSEKHAIFDGQEIKWNGFIISYKRKKIFSVARVDRPNDPCTIYDTASFFKGGFIKVCQSFLGEVPETIEQGKADRASFQSDQIQFIRKYNEQECIYLGRVMNKVYSMVDRLGWTGRSWYGPSAIAGRLLRRYNIKNEFYRRIEDIGKGFVEAVNCAYFGGRIEALKLGTFKNVFDYDINSAYPTAMLKLPLMTRKGWRRSAYWKDNYFSVWNVKWDIPEEKCLIGPFPHRRNGLIKYPLNGQGWYWQPEVEYALKNYPEYVSVTDGYYLDVLRGSTIGDLVMHLYDLRRDLKAKKDDAEYIVKITLNSMYGKFAQHIGRKEFQCIPFAGFITSSCRRQILDAISGNEKYIISISTDGVLSQKSLPVLLGKDLGEWSDEKWDKAHVIMSGVYYLQNKDGSDKEGSRGYRRLDYDRVLGELTKQGTSKVTEHCFFGFKLSQIRNEKENYLKFADIEKVVNPSKLDKRKYKLEQIKNWKINHCDSNPVRFPQIYQSELKDKKSIEQIEIDVLEDFDTDYQMDWFNGVRLLTAIRRKGGINLEYWGDFSRFTKKECGKVGLVTRHKGKGHGVDDMCLVLKAEGYFFETPDDLLEAMIRDLNPATPVYGYA